MLKMIICTDLDGGIGFEGSLLTYVPSDLAYFKKQTEGGIVLMGNKTMESLPFKGGLPNRRNYVLSRYHREDFSNVTYIRRVSDIYKYCLDTTALDVWVIGGASIYEQFKDLVQEIHHTELNGLYKPTDTFFNMDWVKDENVFEQTEEEVLCDIATVKVYRRR